MAEPGAVAACGLSTCSEQGLLSLQGMGFLLRRLLLQEGRALEHGLLQLWNTSLVALKHVDSLQTRDRTPVPYIAGRQTLNHWTTNEVPMPLVNQICFRCWFM